MSVCDLASVRSILVVKLDEVGDFVMATPFLRPLRAAAPQARIRLPARFWRRCRDGPST